MKSSDKMTPQQRPRKTAVKCALSRAERLRVAEIALADQRAVASYLAGKARGLTARRVEPALRALGYGHLIRPRAI